MIWELGGMSPWVKHLLLNYEDLPWALIASGWTLLV